MTQKQSSLGGQVVHRTPSYQTTKIGRVTSIVDYKKYGKIEVVFLDHGYPFPVWVVGGIDREPVTGDQVLVGYMEGRKDAPYMLGFVRNESYTSNFIEVAKDYIRVQLPVHDIGIKNGRAHKDTQGNLLDDSKQGERTYVELTPSKTTVYHPMNLEIVAGENLSIKASTSIVIDAPSVATTAKNAITLDAPSVTAGGENLLVDEV